jgi:hypothetical protein
MFHVIEKLHHQPKATRQAVAVAVSGTITLAILVVWLSAANFDLGSGQVLAEKQAELQANVLSPWQTIERDISSTISQIKSQMSAFSDAPQAGTGLTATTTDPDLAEPLLVVPTTATTSTTSSLRATSTSL